MKWPVIGISMAGYLFCINFWFEVTDIYWSGLFNGIYYFRSNK
ncbi:hypothetical protein QP775_00525 [Paenibacillus sp. UMB4589-SE434]|nr:hypothetical protein [Paenibacillus sp. UMB4589-SE434]